MHLEPSSSGAQAKTQLVHFGIGAVGRFKPLIRELGARSVYLVVDRAAWSASGAQQALTAAFEERAWYVFDDFAVNPKLSDVERGLASYRAQRPDLVVAVGGGSAIDMAKLIRWFGAAAGSPSSPPAVGPHNDVTTGHPPTPAAPPLVAIPTTAGTGSEATQFAVVYRDGEKQSVDDPQLLPNVAIVDPRLTYSLPVPVTAASGLDALCQAIESIWSVGASATSVQLALEAVTLAAQQLATAVRKPNPEARSAMARAAHLAGQAINISRTTACHAFSYHLTSRFGVPHGFAVAITLPEMLLYNASVSASDCCDPRGYVAVRERIGQLVQALGCSDTAAAAAWLRRLMEQVGSPLRLEAVGLRTPEEVAEIVDKVNLQRLANNPRRLPRAAALALVNSIL